MLIQGASALIGPEGMTDLIYILAGAAKIRRERSASLGVPLSDASSAERTDDGTGKIARHVVNQARASAQSPELTPLFVQSLAAAPLT